MNNVSFGIEKRVLDSICELTKKYNYNFYLFGSRARGNFKSNSDIDIAIEGIVSNLDKDMIRNEFDKIDTAYMIDILFIDEIVNEKLIENIIREGVLLG